MCVWNSGAWHVEGIFEELDAAREWFYDKDSEQLYYIPNATRGNRTVATDFSHEAVAPKLETLIAVRGTAHRAQGVTSSETQLVRNITIIGITFAHSRPTYLDDYEAISGEQPQTTTRSFNRFDFQLNVTQSMGSIAHPLAVV